ncbi:MAG: hypothetical protein NTZ63_06940 [Candidatus Omnitrophica bacterium]|nr:hypothetical protein [Candidatus Omnitrophota bacterium]
MLKRRGYSFVMWALVFAVVSAAMAMYFASVKRTLTAKTLNTTDYIMWGMWGNAVQDEGGWNHQQIGQAQSQTTHQLSNKLLENKGKVRAVVDAQATTTSSSRSWQ